MAAELATVAGKIEQVLIGGDLSPLSDGERVNYYKAVCESVGLNPLTKPFDYIRLNGKLVLYAKRDATDQLRKNHGVSVRVTGRDTLDGVYVVTAQATDRTGRVDESTGAVPVKGLSGESLANAFMKAETKAKRRVTLSICGLGLLDETEVAAVPTAEPFHAEPVPKALPRPGGLHESPGVEPGNPAVESFLADIERVGTLQDLEGIGKELAETDLLTPEDKAGLRAVYAARWNKLKGK